MSVILGAMPADQLEKLARQIRAGEARSFVVLTVDKNGKTGGTVFVHPSDARNDFMRLGNEAVTFAERAHASIIAPAKVGVKN